MASAVLLALLGWLSVALRRGELLGLSERVLAGAEAFWPLIVTLTLVAQRRIVAPPNTDLRLGEAPSEAAWFRPFGGGRNALLCRKQARQVKIVAME
jgi:hypothetical protein